MYPFLLSLFTGICICSFSAEAQPADIIKKGAELKLVSDQFSFTEGPAADKNGNIYFTDQPDNKIWKYGIDGKLSVFMDDAGRANGLYFDKDGNLIAAADENDELWSISPTKKVTVLVRDFEGHRLNGPNDLWIDPAGGIYFTDPYYQRKYWERTKPDIKEERVYYLSPDKKEIRIAAADFGRPNGIIGTPNGKKLYIADIEEGKTYSFKIGEYGELSGRKLFTGTGSDGMTIDEHGNIYLTGDGVSVFDKGGKRIQHIDVPEKWTANVTFGGKDGNLLFITASKSVYTLQMNVRGAK